MSYHYDEHVLAALSIRDGAIEKLHAQKEKTRAIIGCLRYELSRSIDRGDYGVWFDAIQSIVDKFDPVSDGTQRNKSCENS